MQKALLSEFFASANVFTADSLRVSYNGLVGSGVTEDEALTYIFLAILATVGCAPMPIETEADRSMQKRLESDVVLLRQIDSVLAEKCVPHLVLKSVLSIASVYMESPGEVHVGRPLYLQEALEATLWRAFDALTAIDALLPLGLKAACDLELRAAQEALLLNAWFLRKPLRAKTFKIVTFREEAGVLADAIRFNRDKFRTVDPRLSSMLAEHLSELSKLGINASLDVNGFLQTRSTVKSCQTKWQGLVAQEQTFGVFGEAHHRLYLDIFLRGNRSAHCLAPFWGGYVKGHASGITLEGSVAGSPQMLGRHAFLTLNDFLIALVAARPQMNSCYSTWLIACMKRSIWKADDDLQDIGTT